MLRQTNAHQLTLGLLGRYISESGFFSDFSICVYDGLCGLVIMPRLCCSCQRRAARRDFVRRMVRASMKAQMLPKICTNATVIAPVAIRAALWDTTHCSRSRQPYSYGMQDSLRVEGGQHDSGTTTSDSVAFATGCRKKDQSLWLSTPQHSN